MTQTCKGLPSEKTKEQLELNRSQLRRVTGLLTWHCQLKRHLFQTWINQHYQLQRMPEQRWNALAQPMWLWVPRWLETTSPRMLLYGTRWPLRCTTVLHSKCGTVKWLGVTSCTKDEHFGSHLSHSFNNFILKFQQFFCKFKIKMFTVIYMPCVLLRSDGRVKMRAIHSFGALKGFHDRMILRSFWYCIKHTSYKA